VDDDEDQECPHSPWMTPQTCTRCNGAEAAAKKEAALDYPSSKFPARYDGQCSGCHLPIHVHEIIYFSGPHQLRHEQC